MESEAGFDVAAVRRDFPALAQEVRGRPLVYLDSASTAQKPRAVVEALRGYYERDCANIHRGVHALSQAATDRYEAVRERVAGFIGAAASSEIVFTSGTTAAVNLVAATLGRRVGEGDEVLVSRLEHHSNLVPWQRLCGERRARLVELPIDAAGRPRLDRLEQVVSRRTRIVALGHASNALGTVVDVAAVAAAVRRAAPGALVVVDGAQAVPHLPVDVGRLGCDFYCFSGHKLFGPTGVGVLWGRGELLAELPPWQGGGDMVAAVRFESATYREPPFRFEAGTPPIAEVIGLGAAIAYVESVGLAAIGRYEEGLRRHAVASLAGVEGLRIFGPHGGPHGGPSPSSGEPPPGDAGPAPLPVLSFTLAGVHPHDAGTALDCEGIAVRTGHHCAQPLMEHLGVVGTVRASLAFYNTAAELDALAEALGRVSRMFR